MAVVVDSARRVRAYPGDLVYSSIIESKHVNDDTLSAFISFVYIRVEVDVRNIAI